MVHQFFRFNNIIKVHPRIFIVTRRNLQLKTRPALYLVCRPHSRYLKVAPVNRIEKPRTKIENKVGDEISKTIFKQSRPQKEMRLEGGKKKKTS